MKTYEGLYILSDEMKDEDAVKTWEAVKSEIQKLGGAVKSEKPPVRHSFARSLDKEQGGHYAEVTFDLSPGNVVSLRNRHALDEKIFRVMITAARPPATDK